jgi:hypothetical protein
MRTTKGDHPVNREESTQPDTLVRTDTETLGTLAAVGAPTPTKHNTAPGFDPWRFGTHDVSAELRKEILEKGFPETPDDKLFTKRHKTDAAEPADKAPGAADGDDPDWDADPRQADTLRLQRQPPLVSPWRAAAPWLVISAISVFVLLWLWFGRGSQETVAPDLRDMPSAAPPSAATPPVHESTSAVSPGPGVPPGEPSAAPDAAPSVAHAPATGTDSTPPKSAAPRTSHPASSPATAQPATVQPAAPPLPVQKPSSSRIVPADD